MSNVRQMSECQMSDKCQTNVRKMGSKVRTSLDQSAINAKKRKNYRNCEKMLENSRKCQNNAKFHTETKKKSSRCRTIPKIYLFEMPNHNLA